VEVRKVALDAVASVAVAESLVVELKTVLADGLSVAVAESDTAEFTWKLDEVASVAVLVSAVAQAKVVKEDVESAAVAFSDTSDENKFPATAAYEVCAKAASPKSILTQLLQLWLQALALGGWLALEQLGSCQLLQHKGVYPNTA